MTRLRIWLCRIICGGALEELISYKKSQLTLEREENIRQKIVVKERLDRLQAKAESIAHQRVGV